MSTGSTPGLAARRWAATRAGGVSGRRLLQRVLIALCLAMLVGLAASYAMLLHDGSAGPKKTDFVPYYSAARLVWEGHGGAVFSLGRLGRFESALVSPLKVSDGVMPYLYPPYFALALAPLAALPFSAAYLVWLILDVVLLLLSVEALRRFAGLRGGSAVLFRLAALSFLPVLVGLAQGQTSILLLALFTGAFIALRAGRPAVAGVLLGCALIKPTYVLPAAAVLLLYGRRRALLSLLVTGAVLFVAPDLVLGAGVNAGYGNTLLQASGWRTQIGGFQARWNDSFAGSAQLLVHGGAATAVAAALCLIACFVLLLAIRRGASFEAAFGLAILLGLLISPHVLIHDLTLVLIPVAVALRLRPPGDRALPWVLAGGYAAVLVGLGLVTAVPVQLSVLAMCALGAWLGGNVQQPHLTDRAVPA